MFFRRKPQAPELTGPAYSRWLRAHRPPLTLFLGLAELEQEALADIGDAHAQELVEAFALALSNPQALAAGVDARDAAQGDTGVEATLAAQLAKGLAAKLAGNQQAAQPVEMPRETMAGFGERKVAELDTKDKRPSFLGKQGVAQ